MANKNKSDVSEFFPLRKIGDVLNLFEHQLKQQNDKDGKEPNLTMLAIVAGAIENSMTQGKPSLKDETSDDFPKSSNSKCDSNKAMNEDSDLTNTNLSIEPVLHWDLVEALYKKFESVIKGFCDVNILEDARRISVNSDTEKYERSKKVRVLIKHVADIIWNTLTKSQYKDRPHLQSIYSYLTGK